MLHLIGALVWQTITLLQTLLMYILSVFINTILAYNYKRSVRFDQRKLLSEQQIE